MNRINRLAVFLVFLWAILPGRADTWRMYSPFAGVESMAETKGRVYYASAGALYAFDKANGETLAFTQLEGLNGTEVTGVYAPFYSTMVAIAYADGQIDILYDNGKLSSLPDIKDSGMPNKNILSIAFNSSGTEMLVATGFGIVRYNMQKLEVLDSGKYDHALTVIAYYGDMPVAYNAGTLYALPSGKSTRDWNNWVKVGNYGIVEMLTVQGRLYAILTEQGVKWPVIYTDMRPGDQSPYRKLTTTPAISLSQGNPMDPLFISLSGSIASVDADNLLTGSYPLPKVLEACPFTAMEGSSDLWFGTKQGLVNADLSSSVPFVGEPINPGEMSVREVYSLEFGNSGNLYIGNRGNSNVFQIGTDVEARAAMLTPDGRFMDITPRTLSSYKHPGTVLTGIIDPLCLHEDPDIPGRYYMGGLQEGLYALSTPDATETLHFTPDNSPLTDYWGVRAQDITFDGNGFMWLLTEAEPGSPSLHALMPQARLDNNEIEKSDWITAELSSTFYASRDGKLIASADGRHLYAKGNNDILIYDTKGTPDLNDDEAEHVTEFIMAEGMGGASFTRITDLMEDPLNGRLWIATTEGLFYIPSPFRVSNGAVEIVKPKVARNDGTQLADYLLSTQFIQGMAMDSNRHIWFVTKDSGIFLTNADGTSILATYNTSNSSLTSNNVLSVAVDPQGSGKVYFGTKHGLLLLESDFSSGAENYDKVKIYPNPVRPDYFGDVTIEGLVAGSYVTILSSAGNRVATLQTEGGTAHWSARNVSGNRVPAGVYYVLAASEKHDGRPVGKIVVIR